MAAVEKQKQTQISSGIFIRPGYGAWAALMRVASIGVRVGVELKTPTDSAEGSLPAWAAAALAGRRAVSVLTVPGTSRHQQLRRLHLTLALFGGVRPAEGIRRSGI